MAISDPRLSHAFTLLMGACLIALSVGAVRVPTLHAFSGDTIADRELGQPDFLHSAPNTVDADVFNYPWHLALDKSVTPNRLYLADAENHRVLGYHSVAALVTGAPADLVIGQPDFYPASCNQGVAGGTTRTSLCRPRGVAVDRAGNLFVADSDNNRVLEYNQPFAAGMRGGLPAAWVLGQGGSFTSGQCNLGGSGPTAATLCQPFGVALDQANNLYVMDSINHRVLEYNAPFTTATRAQRVFGQLGSFTTGTQNKGGISANSLAGPIAVTFDAAGDLFVADSGNARVLEYYTPLRVTPVPGSGDTTADRVFGHDHFTDSVCGLNATRLCNPSGVAVDGAGTLYIGDSGNNRVLQYTPPFAATPVPTRVFGQAGDFTTNGCNFNSSGLEASSATLCNPIGLGFDSTGKLYVGDKDNHRVLRFKPPFGRAPFARLALGQPDLMNNSPNSVDPAGLNGPVGVALDLTVSPPHLYVADNDNHRVLGYRDAVTFLNNQDADLVLGQPDFYTALCNAHDTGPPGPTERQLCHPQGLAVDAAGNLFVADSDNHRVLQFGQPFQSGYTANQPAMAVFGQGGSFSSGDCNSQSGISRYSLCHPTGVAINRVTGTVYVADQKNNRVLAYTPPFAANPAATQVVGQRSFTTNSCNRGAPTPAQNTLCQPTDVAVDGAGNLYVADSGSLRDGSTNNRVLEYTSPLVSGASAHLIFGQGGSPTAKSCNVTANGLCTPTGVALDPAGNLYVADSANHRVLEYNTPLRTTGTAGSGDTTADRVFGQSSFTANSCNRGGTTPTAASLCEPERAVVDSTGNLYVADSANSRALKYDKPL